MSWWAKIDVRGVSLVSLVLVAVVLGATSCSAPVGEACATNSDCEPGYECVSSGGVVFGERICLLSDAPAGDVGMDAGGDGTSDAFDGGAGDAGDTGDAGPGGDADAGSDICGDAGCPPDFDDDGVPDDQDNCPLIANAGQENLDEDASGDACDSDIDGDGVANSQDNCPEDPNPSQGDLDGDSIGDGCDDDDDGDGVDDVDDNCPVDANPEQDDLDGDGSGDVCDTDSDGDGHDNTSDICPDRINPQQDDRDRDGIGDACDSRIGGAHADVIYSPQFSLSNEVTYRVASGDVTGDGIDDLLIAGPGIGFLNSAAVYVIDGANPGSGDVNLNNVVATITTSNFDENLGLQVAFAGDVNGDGTGDLLIGNPGENGNDGAAYIFYGGAGLSGDRTMASADVRIFGNANRQAGFAVAGIGDVNGDGVDDVGFGQPEGLGGEGVIGVLFGSATLPASQDIGASDIQLAGANNERAGAAIAGAGDVNGDGVDDFLVGAPHANNKSGAAVLVYGYAAGTATPPTGTLLRDEGVEFLLGGPNRAGEGLIGTVVLGAGDLDGDGHLDLAVSAPETESTFNRRPGAAYVFFGSGSAMPSRGSSIDLGGNAVRFDLPVDEARVGSALAAGGDIDGDGHPDLLIGASQMNVSGNLRAGAVYLVSDLASLTGSVGTQVDLITSPVSFLGVARDDAFGSSVAVVGDLDADGRSEVLISAPLADAGGRNDAGAAFLFYGL